MALAQVEAGLDAHAAAYAERLHRWQEMTIANVLDSIRIDDGAAITMGGPVLNGSKRELANDLENIRTRIANFGRGQLNEELKRQARRPDAVQKEKEEGSEGA